MDFKDIPYYIKLRDKRYKKYYNKTNISPFDVIHDVNCNLDYKYYKHDIKTNTKQGNTIIVNKYYKLSHNYIPNDLITIDSNYSFKGKATVEASTHFIDMVQDAYKQHLFIMNESSYRSYQRQKELYDIDFKVKGYKTDETLARPGYSEHQTGLAFDVRSKDKDMNKFVDTKEYLWMLDNSYKYGFILRYPKGKEKLTGYNYEPWHFRYLGIDLATKVYESKLTYDEYYAYYIEKR